MKQYQIKATIEFQTPFWVAIFERIHNKQYTVARKIFGQEPADSELYEFILKNYKELKFTQPQSFTLNIKRKNPKRVKREVKREVAKLQQKGQKTSHAQEVLRLELEKNKKVKKQVSKKEKAEKAKKLFAMKQEKKKKKIRGH